MPLRFPRVARVFAHTLYRVVPVILVMGGSLASRPAQAETITVPNFSFEAPSVTESNTSNSVTGWTIGGDAGVYNPPSTEFTGAGSQGTPSGADGAQIAYANAGGSLQSAASLTNVQSGTTYSLTVALGENLAADPGNVRVGFLLNDAFVTGRDITFNASNYATRGTFRDYTFSFTSNASDAGKTLKIYLGQTTGNDYVGFDNVRLNTTATPEPETWAMMGLGVFALGVFQWRRRKTTLQAVSTLPGLSAA